MRILDYERDLFIKLVKKLPKEHQCVLYYNRLHPLKDEQYYFIVDMLKEKIKKYYNQEHISVKVLSCEEDVNILSEILLNSSKYDSLEKYMEHEKTKNNYRVLYLFGKNFYYGDNKELGLCYIKNSAKQDYEYALRELVVIEYNNDNYTESIIIINKLLNSTDKFILDYINLLLAQIYYYGNSEIEKDYKKALEHIKKSYTMRESKLLLAKMYYYGHEVERNYSKAFEIFSNLNSNKVALFYLGEMYRLGEGIQEDKVQAYNYYKKASEMGYSRAEYELAKLYLSGDGIEKDIDKAIYWLEKSAESSDEYAQYQLGLLYYYGEYEGTAIIQNREYAIELFSKSASSGCTEAKEFLDSLKKDTHMENTSVNNSKFGADASSKIIFHIDSAE